MSLGDVAKNTVRRAVPAGFKPLLRNLPLVSAAFAGHAKGDPEVHMAIHDLVRPGDTALDCGANVGQETTVLARLVGKHGHVYAFEPNPVGLMELKRVTQGLRNCTIEPYVLCDVGSGKIDFYLDERPGSLGGGSSMLEPITNLYGAQYVRRVALPSIRLDDYVREKNIRVDFVKMDVEGAEFMALRGFMDTLTKVQPHMVLEYSTGIATSPDVLSLLDSLGYDVIDLHSFESVDRHYYTKNTDTNILAIHRSKRSSTRYHNLQVRPVCSIAPHDVAFQDREGECLERLGVSLEAGRYTANFDLTADGNPNVAYSVCAGDLTLRGIDAPFNVAIRYNPLPFEIKGRTRIHFSLRRLGAPGTVFFKGIRLNKVLLNR